MNTNSLLTVVLSTILSLSAAACHLTGDDDGTSDASSPDAGSATDGGALPSACYIASQFRCKELPRPTAQDVANLEVECSSASGVPSSPPACPAAGFVGKCTVPGASGSGPEVRRFYDASDAAYQQDFCVNTALGVWSTAF